MEDVFELQAQLIALFQREALRIKSENPLTSVDILLNQINTAFSPLKDLTEQNTYHTLAQLKQERDAAVGSLCRLIDLILGTKDTMEPTQQQIDAAYAKSQAVLEFYNQHSQELSQLQNQVSDLAAQLQSATTDKQAALAQVQQLQSSLDAAQANLSKFVTEFTDSTSTPAEPAPAPTPVEPAPSEPAA